MVVGDGSEAQGKSQRVAVVIPAHDGKDAIASTVRACMAIPSVDLIVVVDDGSSDDTAQVARSAGAVTIRHSVMRGRASAMETGVKVVAMRDRNDWPPRLILFLEQDLGDRAIEATALVQAVESGTVDCAIAAVRRPDGRHFGGNAAIAWKGIWSTTGWVATDPLSTQRCLTREAISAVMPFSTGWGVNVGMTIDLLVEGFSVVEIPCDLRSAAGKGTSLSLRQREARRRDIWMAANKRRFMRRNLPKDLRTPVAQQEQGEPYRPLGSAR